MCCSGKVISFLFEENLVDVEFENLIFGKVIFDFEGKKGFVKFVCIGFFFG